MIDDLREPERHAIEISHLRSLPPEVLAALLADSVRIRIPAGSTLHREGESEPHVRLVVSGLLRAFVSAPDGRTLTVRYCRTGALLGVASLFSSSFALPVSIQAITDSGTLALSPSLVRRSAGQNVHVAAALLEELSERVLSFIAEIPGGAFATIRERVSRHLLDMATPDPGRGRLAAAITQQELAEAVGTTREVVVRALRTLRADGLVETRRDRIVLIDPERLTEDAYPPADGPHGRAGWNESS
ncbi:MAG: Crp/Fnr family transcriptional regulator [Alphaproteobacteria bacterium]